MSEPIERLRVMRILARMNVGGPALQATVLARGLDPVRYEQRLYVGHLAEGETGYLDLRAPDVRVVDVRGLGRSVRPADDLRACGELAVAMRRFRPHIVHTHTAKAGALGRLAALAARVPARVHTFHGHLLHGYFSPGRTRVLVMAERALARTSSHLVAVGEQVRDDLISAGIGHDGQYTVVPPGTHLRPLPDRATARARLDLPPNAPVVAYVGRVTGIKRPDRLLAVARDIRRAEPSTRFVVCGDGDQIGLLAADTTVAPSLRLLGWRSDIETVYAAADVVVLTSDNEGMPVCLIEAALAGVPVVATRVGSVAEVVCDGTTGVLTSPSADEIATAVIRLLRDDRLRRRMGRAAREFAVERFDEHRLVSDIDRLYTSIAQRRGWWPRTAEEVTRS
jgi:glycosyltransferase involved in cell wall biosynthesis